MRKDGAERRTELLRKLVHVGSGFIAVALAWLTWQQALALAAGALVFNAFILPRIGGKALHREDDLRRGHAFGILMYPTSVIILILAFRERLEFVAIGWALMAFGDGMASVVGSMVGRHHLPWNRAKSWEGVAAHVLFGGGAALAIGAFVAHARGADLPLQGLAVAVFLGALVTAIVESIESGVDDNILVPLLGAGLCFVVVNFDPSGLSALSVQLRAGVSTALCAILAVGAWWRGKLSVVGALGAAVLGIVVATGGGFGLFAALCAFFAIGVSATRIGGRVKEERGIAEARGGKRGLGNVLANGGMAGLMAALAFPRLDHDGPALSFVACGIAALATSAFDTCSSEIGKAYGRRTVLPTTLRAVPPGTEGAISLEGTLAGAVGALLVAAMGVGVGLIELGGWSLPSVSWFLLAFGLLVLSAFIGSMFESIVGALCHDRGHHVQNDFMNFANTVVGAAAMVIMLSWI